MTTLVDGPVTGVDDGAEPAARRPGPAARVLIAAVRGYQLVVSARYGGACRFEPTCSEYGLEALREWGAVRGSGLTAYRFVRCQPLCPGGYDPVPVRGGGHRENSRGGDPGPGSRRTQPTVPRPPAPVCEKELSEC